jgi:hypothetical protein
VGRAARQARLRARVRLLGEQMGVEIPEGWSGCDPVWPLIERIREEGAIFVIKLDGERARPGDNGPYTVLCSGGPLKPDEFLRGDFHSLEAGLSRILLGYGERVWSFPPDDVTQGRDC